MAGDSALNSLLYKAIGKSMLGRYAVYAANVVSLVVLARLFAPSDYGVVASVLVIYMFMQMMAEGGLSPALINLRSLSPNDRDGLFSLTLLSGLTLGAILYISSPLLQTFYREPSVSSVVPSIAVALIFSSANIIPNSLLLRDQKFLLIARSGLFAELISTLATISAMGFATPLVALAIKTPTSAAINFASNYYLSKKSTWGRPFPGTRLSAVRKIMSFSSYQLAFNFINYFARNFDNLLVGKYFGAGALGAYDKAYQLMRYPLMLLTFAMTPAIQPVVRQYGESSEQVEAMHRSFTLKLSLLGCGAGLAVFLLAERLVHAVLGPQWDSVVPIIRILAMAIPVQTVLSTSGSFFQALERVNLLFISGLFSATLLLGAMAYGIYERDISKLCWALVVAFHLNFIQAYLLMYSRVFKKSSSGFFLRMAPGAVVVVLMAAHA